MTKIDPSAWIGAICGEYRLTRLLGEGRESSVFIASNISTQSLAAVKIFHKGGRQEEAARLFASERGRLNHPNIVSQLAFGTVKDDFFFTVQEFVAFKKVGSLDECFNLEEYVSRTEGLLSEDTIVDLMGQLMDALCYAHGASNIPYGGISPRGILVVDGDGYSKRPVLKISDLGMPAVRTSDGQDEAYIAPEEIQGRPDIQSDIFSLGGILHLLLTGTPPTDQMAPPQAMRPDVSAGWEGLLKRALAFSKESRYESFQEFAHYVNHVDEVPAVKKEKSPQQVWFYLSCLVCLLLILGFAFRDQLRANVPLLNEIFPTQVLKPVQPSKSGQNGEPQKAAPSAAKPITEVPLVVEKKTQEEIIAPSGTALDGTAAAKQKEQAGQSPASPQNVKVADGTSDSEAKAIDAVLDTEKAISRQKQQEKAENLAEFEKAQQEKAAKEAAAKEEQLKKAMEAAKTAAQAKLEAEEAAKKEALKAQAEADAKAKAEAQEKAQAEAENKAKGVYVVKKGDTLWGIASKNGLKAADLLALNGLEEGAVIKEGMTLKLAAETPAQKAETTPAAQTKAKTVRYAVQKGDTYFSLSKKFGISVQELQELNGGRNLVQGFTLTIPVKE